jgi:hypothetical protein
MINRACFMLAITGLSIAAAAQQSEPAKPSQPPAPVVPPAPVAEEAKPPTPAKPADDLPSLDELLGTGGDKPNDAAAPDPEKAALDKLLSGEELGQAFEQAVGLMKDAAKRLSDTKDVGLSTQRIQEDALRKLDQLISSLDRQAQQQQQQQSQGEQDQQQSQPRQRQQQQSQQTSQQPATGEPQEHEGPELQEGALNPELDSARAAWGALPARVRQMLLQGSNDRFSSLYNRLTQDYYRRLAEESSVRP